MTPAAYALIGFALAIGIVTALAILFRAKGGGDSQIASRLQSLEQGQEREERIFRDELARNREESAGAAKAQREELSGSLRNVSETTLKSLTEISAMVRAQLDQAIGQTRRLTENVDLRLKELREENSQHIEKMRVTVDEKLQGTLEKRLGESYKLVSERLEQVHQGLGAMQQLASDVGGLQRVLTNVKTRGGWGEVQLGALLEQLLTPEQFGRNVRTREDGSETVEFAIKLPGDGNGASVWLPIDAKFPIEDYHRLVAAQEKSDIEFAEAFVAVKKIVVFSKTLEKVEEENIEIVRSNLIDEILKLKQQPGQSILTGGVDIPSQLIQLGLVDEYRFVIFPVLGGEGKRLLENVKLQEKSTLKLVETRTFKSGSVVLRYVKQ